MTEWPTTDLDPVRRMQVLAASLSAAYAELEIPVAYDRAWSYIADMERSIPDLVSFIRRFELVGEGERRTAHAVGILRGDFAVELRDGFCLMQDRFVVGGFAARPAGDATLVAACGVGRVPGLRRVGRVLAGDRGARHVLRRLSGILESGAA